MSHAKNILLVLLTAASLSFGQEMKPATHELMSQIAYRCDGLLAEPLAFPRPEQLADREAMDFHENAKYLERDLATLRQLEPAALESSTVIRGKQFNAQLNAALAYIEHTRTALKKDAEVAPKQEALSYIDAGLTVANRAFKETHDYAGLVQAHQIYEASMRQAKEIDARALERRKSEITQSGEPFIAKYLAAKSAHEATLAAKRTEKLAAAEASKKMAKRNWDNRKAEAKKHGFDQFEIGIINVIEQLQDGSITLPDAKGFLIYHEPEDDFRVQSVVGKYALYFFRQRDVIFQIAVVRETDGYYGEGAELKGTMFGVVGMQGFKTVMGTGKEVLVLKSIR